ncbi:MAG: hypothetical protein F4029_19075 [Gammaproteobacteria bacterium]|nr:hypothetical protein [Gammaproteobacteria bacterium]MYF29099.1 hypothetical protein [Gammaproteobacteria bacterium]MYK48318.1 hypothetical protein [Gammaproteobacteria bacterium]
MTAEVAIANKTAVVMAADNAVTRASKVHSRQKLFPLVREENAVGVMFCQNVAFMGVPWGTIIAMYRQAHGGNPRPTVQNYARDFLDYIAKEPFCTEASEQANVDRIVQPVLARIRAKASELFQTSENMQAALHRALSGWLDHVAEMAPSPSMESVAANEISARVKDSLGDLAARVFVGYDLGAHERELLAQVVEHSLKCKPMSPLHPHFSGLVFAGFGEDEIFPSLVCATTQGLVCGRHKHHIDVYRGVERHGPFIEAYAQHAMVHRLIDGLDPAIVEHLRQTLGRAMHRLVSDVLDSFLNTDINYAVIRPAIEEHVARHLDDLAGFCGKEFAKPILDNLEGLSKQELADMAEAFVSITALKSRVADPVQSVGGPIDVAVITKGEGFIWAKRKNDA